VFLVAIVFHSLRDLCTTVDNCFLGCGKPRGLTPLRYSTEYPNAIANRIGVSKSNCYKTLCKDFGPQKIFAKELDPGPPYAIGLTGCFALDRRSDSNRRKRPLPTKIQQSSFGVITNEQAYLPAEQPSSCKDPRFPSTHEDPCRSCHLGSAPPQGPRRAFGLNNQPGARTREPPNFGSRLQVDYEGRQ